jgi:small subunit ribosomal protein S26e
MPKKRRNSGRNKNNKGKSISVHCNNCTRLVPKDKAIKRFIIKNMVDSSSKRDIEEASAYNEENASMPKLFVKNQWCVACAIHARIVKVRSTENKKIRYVSKYRPSKRAEMTKLYRVANQRLLETNNPFTKKQEQDGEE